VVCCTTAGEPLFDGALVADHAAVAAVGSHSPTGREVDGTLVRRSACYVEARAVALREAGDLLLPLPPAAAADWTNLAELVTGAAEVGFSRPRFFKSVGMAWQDLAVAAEIHRRHGR
jgi:ornithine cyclodeaminase